MSSAGISKKREFTGLSQSQALEWPSLLLSHFVVPNLVIWEEAVFPAIYHGGGINVCEHEVFPTHCLLTTWAEEGDLCQRVLFSFPSYLPPHLFSVFLPSPLSFFLSHADYFQLIIKTVKSTNNRLVAWLSMRLDFKNQERSMMVSFKLVRKS